MARLIITSPDAKRNILELTRPLTLIGRGKSNDLVLNNTSVSRLHAVVRSTDEGFTIADRGSTNGVLVNGDLIASETLLADGDTIHIGDYDLRFETLKEERLVVASAPVATTLEHVLQWRPERTGVDAVPLPHAEAVQDSMPEVMQQFWKLEHENYLLRLLFDAGKALHGKISVDEIANTVVELAFRIHGVERGFIMLMDEQGEVTRQTEVKFRHPPVDEVQPQIILSRSILEKVRKQREPILIMDAAIDERFTQSESLRVSGLRSAMCAPLAAAGSRDVTSIGAASDAVSGASGELFGVLYVDNMEKAEAFSQEEMNVFAVIATQAAAAIDNAMSHRKIAEQAVQQRALERFLSPEVVAMIAKDPHGIRLGGANQKVTVMFADIRGFTSLAEKMAPEQVVEILNEYFTRVTEIIFDFGGTLDKYLGDGVMAVFGAPLSKGNDALNAVKAATAIQRMVKELNRDASERNWPELHVGIGINTGVVTAGNIGSPRRLDYTVVGDAVNVAARLMASAEKGQILITDETKGELPNEFSVAALPPLKVKGKAESLNVYSLERRAAARAANRRN